jgi:hypothetical protein
MVLSKTRRAVWILQQVVRWCGSGLGVDDDASFLCSGTWIYYGQGRASESGLARRHATTAGNCFLVLWLDANDVWHSADRCENVNVKFFYLET